MPAYLYPLFKYLYDKKNKKNKYIPPKKVQEIPQQRQDSGQVNMDREEISYEEYAARDDEQMLRTPVEQMSYQELVDEWHELATVPEKDWSRRCRILAQEIDKREQNGQR